MKIALVGPPKSGKTKYARGLKDEGYLVIDNIPQKFAKATGLAIGFGADYRVDVTLAGIRFQEYYKATRKSENVVMTTTFLDSVCYSVLGFEDFEYDNAISVGGDADSILKNSDEFPYFISSTGLMQFFRNSWLFDKTIVLKPKVLEDGSESARLYSNLTHLLESSGVEFEIADPK